MQASQAALNVSIWSYSLLLLDTGYAIPFIRLIWIKGKKT